MTTTTTIDRSFAQASALTAEQVAALAAPLSRANVKQRDQGRGKVSYIEGWTKPLRGRFKPTIANSPKYA